ncbi:ArsB/NhaD superfamily anion permease [Candidatus Megaera venefica]|uniref:ArsB/NhaD superfamily anion permease n=1 Tax=Candidatus Megaera venefica TaxID=2055910 RepID=A0ABU5NDQ8_9RICK|nr:DASS family sodium-coupled anion symporter [Candidatus Megaera venefica]MEA0971288.1 ArsB/NhaD superfamily anion permease [Candidatus Megaera venefica]
MLNKAARQKNNLILLLTISLSLIAWYLPISEAISINAWHLLIIFIATIIGIILNPLPMGVIALLSILACVLTNTLSLSECLSGFGDSIVWLVVFAFFISNGFIKTGLGSRVAYYVLSKIGHSTLGISYALVIADFVLSPLIPSATARGGGVIFPIAKSICKSFSDDEHPGVSSKNGGFIMSVCTQSTVITSTLFITAMAANPLAVKLAENAGYSISWTDWAIAAIVPGIVSLAVMPLVVYYLYPPTIKYSDSAPKIAKEKLAAMGRLSIHEIIMMVVFVVLIGLWINGPRFGLEPTTVALIGLSILFVTRVINFEDNLADKGAWHTFIWFATLVMLSDFLSKFGLMTWIGTKLQFLFIDTSPINSLVILSLLYFYIHYFFASSTAHITVLLPTFLVLFVNAGVPGALAALILSFLSTLSAGLTHFGLSSTPIFFGAGYMKTKDWWYIGLVTSIVYLLVWIFIGGAWWKLLKLW